MNIKIGNIKIVKKIIYSVFFYMLFIIYSASVNAQNQNQVFPDSRMNRGFGDGTTEAQSVLSFEWMWILPLLAIPLFFLIVRGTEDERINYSSGRQRLVGVKGGRSSKIKSKKKKKRSKS